MIIPVILAVLVTAAAIAAVLSGSTGRADALALQRQQQLIQLVLDQGVKAMGHEQEASTVWDDTIVQLNKPQLDMDWLDNNIGVWMGTYYGHEEIYVLSPSGQPVYAMRAGKRSDPAEYREHAPVIGPLVRELRAKIAKGEEPDPADKVLSLGAVDLGIVHGHPAIVSAKPVVSDTGNIEQAPGTEFVHVSIRRLDGSFAAMLRDKYLFQDVRFDWRGTRKATETSYPIFDRAGRSMGHFVWKPFAPGADVIADLGPALGGALAMVAIIAALLVIRIRRSTMQLVASEAQAQHLAFHDSLTGLPNRAKFDDRLGHELARVKRGHQTIALLYLDLDRFKHVNDSFGHPVGDELIRMLGKRLRAIAREMDTVARLGGDEFAIVQTGISTPADTELLCLRIVEAVAEPFDIHGTLIHVGISIGIAVAPKDGTDQVELTRKADIALYHAKANGKGRFVHFVDPMDKNVQQRKGIERELRAALIDHKQLSVCYQPLFSTNPKKLVGCEALARWIHPVHGPVSPTIFIPIAEEAGLIERLGRWVLEEACRTAVERRLPSISINVSPIQLRNPGYAAEVLELLAKAGLEPARLELEITETCLIEDAEQYRPNIGTLRKAGVRVALDDFGTGYSSLSHLRNFDVDRVKIDRSFVSGLDQEEGGPIIQAIVDLARATGLKVTAEGVETAQQRRFLTSIGCNEMQGFLLGRPMSSDDLGLFMEGNTVQALRA